MPDSVQLSQIPALLLQFASDCFVETCDWRTNILSQSCMVSGIRTAEAAGQLCRFFRSAGFTSEVLSPTDHISSWSVVVIQTN